MMNNVDSSEDQEKVSIDGKRAQGVAEYRLFRHHTDTVSLAVKVSNEQKECWLGCM